MAGSEAPRRFGVLLPAALALGLMPAAAAAEGPLSAIDWLSRSVMTAPELPEAPRPVGGNGLVAEPISVMPLDAPTTDALGLLPADRAGLPRDLWGMTPSAELAALMARLGPDTLPALQALTLRLLLAELDPPRDAEGRGALFLARIERLRAFGALDQALALVEAADPAEPELVAHWFALSLLAGDVAPVCGLLNRHPDLAPTTAARIYCHTRAGEWEAADALLASAEDLPGPLAAALERFLDPEADHDDGPPLAAVADPLMWQLADALGQAWPTAGLPLEFAHADLGPSAGWKAQLEAAERLTRAGALTPNRLLGLYTERAPAASGGVWERARAMQRLEAAILAEEASAVEDVLPQAWALMREAELEVALAELFAERLLRMELPAAAAALAFRAGLLTPAAAQVAAAHVPADPREGFLKALADGTLSEATELPSGAIWAAIREGMLDGPSAQTAALLEEGRRGELLLRAMALFQEGGAADPHAVAEGLRQLRAAGQSAVARQAALQVLLLDRRG